MVGDNPEVNLLAQTKCQVNRSPLRATRPAEDSAKWAVKTSDLVSAAWFIAHRRDFRAASGNSQNTEFQPGFANCSGWCITSPQNRACSPRELKLTQGLDGIERQFGDLDDYGIAYAVGGDLWFHVLLAIDW
jgi:hypothetical protein